ncbi:MAG: cobyric acid synthase [Limnothrix sp.]
MRAIAVFSPTHSSGKSWFATALCRWLAREGWKVAPFQSQSEVKNCYHIDQETDVSYSIAWQAWAAGIPVSADLNPVLLKPQMTPSVQYQLYIQGRGIGTVSRSDYYQNYYNIAKPLIEECLDKVRAKYDLLVFDTYRHGLYDPNTLDTDANFELLKHAELHPAGVILVDCQKGGALNQLWGLWQRLSKENRQMVRGVVFNQWSGDRRFCDPETRWVKEHLNRPVLGYVPPLANHFYHPESPVTFESEASVAAQNQLKIQVLRLPNITRYEDLDALESEPSIQLSYFDPAEQLGYPDAIVIPHTTDAIADLQHLHKYNCHQQLQNYAAAGGTIIGLCDGANLLAKQIISTNPNVEPQTGLNLLPFDCNIQQKLTKDPCQTLSSDLFPSLPIQGTKLYLGNMNFALKRSFTQLFNEKDLGVINQGKNIWAIYLQGLFNNGPWRRSWLNELRHKRGLSSLPTGIPDFKEQQEVIIDTLADHLDQYVDLSYLLTDYDY